MKAPEGLLEHGIRDYIKEQLRGRPLSGSVKRSYNSDLGQHLILNLYGKFGSHLVFENEFLASFENQGYWIWITIETEKIPKLPITSFIISN